MFQQGRLDERADLLTKPFNRSQLAERVRRLMDSHSRVAPAHGGGEDNS
jgi:hypothetical protein